MSLFDSNLTVEQVMAKLTRYLWNVPTTITEEQILEALPSYGVYDIQIEPQLRTPFNQAHIVFRHPKVLQACPGSLIVNRQKYNLHNAPIGGTHTCPNKQFGPLSLVSELVAKKVEDNPAEMAAYQAVAAVEAAATKSPAERAAAAAVATGVPPEPPFVCYLLGPESAVRRMLIAFELMTVMTSIHMQVLVNLWPVSIRFKTRDDLIAFLAGGNAANSSVRLIPAQPE